MNCKRTHYPPSDLLDVAGIINAFLSWSRAKHHDGCRIQIKRGTESLWRFYPDRRRIVGWASQTTLYRDLAR